MKYLLIVLMLFVSASCWGAEYFINGESVSRDDYIEAIKQSGEEIEIACDGYAGIKTTWTKAEIRKMINEELDKRFLRKYEVEIVTPTITYTLIDCQAD